MKLHALDLVVALAADGEIRSVRGGEGSPDSFRGPLGRLEDLAAQTDKPALRKTFEDAMERGNPAGFEFQSPTGGAWYGWLVPVGELHAGEACLLLLRDLTRENQGQSLLRGERAILEMMARGEPLAHLLEAQAHLIESLADGLLCSILLLSRDGKHLLRGAAPSLPQAYTDAIHGAAIGPRAGSCGTAAFTGKLTIASDIATDPLWEDYKALALRHELRACWSAPIISSKGAVLGTFAMYYQVPGAPENHHYELIRHATDLCAIAIEHHNTEVERRGLEQHVLHVQKLESLGVLAGGIAHDFNNILTTILGNTDLALQSLAPGAPARDNLSEIEFGARRAADLATQMLDYSGRGKFKTQPIQIDVFVEEMLALLKVSISKQVRLDLQSEDLIPSFVGDTTQVRQVIMNLVTNASESIGDQSGVICVTTGVMHCDSDYLRSGDMVTWDPLLEDDQSGLHVYVEVTDTGCGMANDVLGKIFDPFYTTKLAGRGLGLAATLGIVRGHQGSLKVNTEVGGGSTFRVLFPVAEETPATSIQPPRVDPGRQLRGLSGSVLLVDDEATIRSLCANFMRSFGLTVLTAADGQEALDVYADHGAQIDVVLLDVTMPRVDGHEAYRRLRQADPTVEVILCSGYSETEVRVQVPDKGLAGVLQKPYTSRELFAVLAPLLSGPRVIDTQPGLPPRA